MYQERKWKFIVRKNWQSRFEFRNVTEAVVWRCTVEKVFLEILQNSQENTCARVSFYNKLAGLRPETLLKWETLVQVFSYEFCEISKNTLFYRTPLVAVSDVNNVTHPPTS